MDRIQDKRVSLRLEFDDREALFLLDYSSALYDVELLHDVLAISFLDDYKDYRINPTFFYRKPRPVKPEHRLQLIRIVKVSPLILDLAVYTILAAPMIIALLKLTGKSLDWWLKRKKLRAELKKAEIEVETALKQKEAWNTLNTILKRLVRNPLQIKDFFMEDEDKE